MFSFFKKSSNYYDFMKFHKLFFGISATLILISIISFFIRGLNFGVDFTGGLWHRCVLDDCSPNYAS